MKKALKYCIPNIVENLKRGLKTAYELAAASAGKVNQNNKRRYYEKVHQCE